MSVHENQLYFYTSETITGEKLKAVISRTIKCCLTSYCIRSDPQILWFVAILLVHGSVAQSFGNHGKGCAGLTVVAPVPGPSGSSADPAWAKVTSLT